MFSYNALEHRSEAFLFCDAPFFPRPSPLRSKVLLQALKNAGQPLIPLVPIVATRAGMILISKMILREQFRKPAVRWQETFLLAARDKNVWGACGINGLNEHVGIVVVPGF